MTQSVAIIGGGLAGLATATALAPYGLQISLYESRPRLGGRASSFDDAASGQLVDTCQHVSMGCCTNFAHFCRTVGISDYLKPLRCLYFKTPDRRTSRFYADPFPAPFHLARSFIGLHHLGVAEKIGIARALLKLKKLPEDTDTPFSEWLDSQSQTPQMIDRFWGLVLISALNEEPDRIGLRYARKVFVDGFLRHPKGFEVQLPSVPLGRLYGEELQQWLKQYNVSLHLGTGVKEIVVRDQAIQHLELRNGEKVKADWYVSSVPFDRLLSLLPEEFINKESYFGQLRQLEISPITSAHCWYDRPVMRLPHVVLVDCMGQWVFNRGEVAPGEHYLQVVISAAGKYRSLGHSEIQRLLTEELARLFPPALPGALKRCRIVTEHAATFSAVPGVDQWRPQQQSPLDHFLLAGDWTATGWPATMEGAVRSGYLAAEALLKKKGDPQRILQADL